MDTPRDDSHQQDAGKNYCLWGKQLSLGLIRNLGLDSEEGYRRVDDESELIFIHRLMTVPASGTFERRLMTSTETGSFMVQSVISMVSKSDKDSVDNLVSAMQRNEEEIEKKLRRPVAKVWDKEPDVFSASYFEPNNTVFPICFGDKIDFDPRTNRCINCSVNSKCKKAIKDLSIAEAAELRRKEIKEKKKFNVDGLFGGLLNNPEVKVLLDEIESYKYKTVEKEKPVEKKKKVKSLRKSIGKRKLL